MYYIIQKLRDDIRIAFVTASGRGREGVVTASATDGDGAEADAIISRPCPEAFTTPSRTFPEQKDCFPEGFPKTSRRNKGFSRRIPEENNPLQKIFRLNYFDFMFSSGKIIP